jgi:dipeptidyl aminopeptidase/acylaminoacyl peptidase
METPGSTATPTARTSHPLAPKISPLLPESEQHGEELLRERSAVYWAEKINVPVFILHGGADWRAEPRSQAQAFAKRLQELGKTYELIIYPDDDHGLSLNRAESDRRIVEWFRRYMK